LGKLDVRVSEVGFGGIPVVRLKTDEAVAVLRYAYDKGITFYDTANGYRDSEAKMGIAFRGFRDKVVIATKTMRRDGVGLIAHLNNSLRMLQTDYIDLFQLHQVSRETDWQTITAPGGALEALYKAREQGKVRYIGVTSHSLPMALRLVETGLFSTIQFPFNFIETAAEEDLFPVAQKQGMGILAMKPFAGGVIDNAAVAFSYLRQFPGVLPIPGFDSIASVDEITGLYQHPHCLTDEDKHKMDQYRQDLGKAFCRRCEYCQPCPSGVLITPAMGYRIVAARFSPPVAAQMLQEAMETVPKCTECGACIQRCPYDLPIPEMIKKHFDLYTEGTKKEI
jgi:hypothetical protein